MPFPWGNAFFGLDSSRDFGLLEMRRAVWPRSMFHGHTVHTVPGVYNNRKLLYCFWDSWLNSSDKTNPWVNCLNKTLKICFDSSGVILGSRSCAHIHDPISFNNLNLVNLVIRNQFYAYKKVIYVCTLAFQHNHPSVFFFVSHRQVQYGFCSGDVQQT